MIYGKFCEIQGLLLFTLLRKHQELQNHAQCSIHIDFENKMKQKYELPYELIHYAKQVNPLRENRIDLLFLVSPFDVSEPKVMFISQCQHCVLIHFIINHTHTLLSGK